MRDDLYLRAVLSVIAAALLYLCVILTPVPGVQAQQPAKGALRPGDSTGPAEMVIVGLRLGDGQTLPVEVRGGVTVRGPVQTEPLEGSSTRVVLAGWEETRTVRAGNPPGEWRPFGPTTRDALPVNVITR
jgi:hypothetical protein